MRDFKWSPKEKKIARQAFDVAYRREMDDLKNKIKVKALQLKKDEEIWQLEDFLYKKRKQIDRKYDYRYSRLIFVFTELLLEGYLKLEDIEGLSNDKIEAIKTAASLRT